MFLLFLVACLLAWIGLASGGIARGAVWTLLRGTSALIAEFPVVYEGMYSNHLGNHNVCVDFLSVLHARNRSPCFNTRKCDWIRMEIKINKTVYFFRYV